MRYRFLHGFVSFFFQSQENLDIFFYSALILVSWLDSEISDENRRKKNLTRKHNSPMVDERWKKKKKKNSIASSFSGFLLTCKSFRVSTRNFVHKILGLWITSCFLWIEGTNRRHKTWAIIHSSVNLVMGCLSSPRFFMFITTLHTDLLPVLIHRNILGDPVDNALTMSIFEIFGFLWFRILFLVFFPRPTKKRALLFKRKNFPPRAFTFPGFPTSYDVAKRNKGQLAIIQIFFHSVIRVPSWTQPNERFPLKEKIWLGEKKRFWIIR